MKVNRPDNNPRTPVLTINNVYGLRRAAQMGLGITTIPDYIVGTSTNLVMIPLDQDPPAFDTYLAYAEEMRRNYEPVAAAAKIPFVVFHAPAGGVDIFHGPRLSGGCDTVPAAFTGAGPVGGSVVTRRPVTITLPSPDGTEQSLQQAAKAAAATTD